MDRNASEVIDRLMLLTQKGVEDIERLKIGFANYNSETGAFFTQPWEYDHTKKGAI